MRTRNIVVTIVFIVALIYVITLNKRIKRRAYVISFSNIAPFMKSGSYVNQKLKILKNEIQLSSFLEKENLNLKTQLEELKIKLQYFDQIRQENDSLRAAIDFGNRSKLKIVSASVITRNPNTWWKSFIIDRGKKDGLSEGCPVITDKGLLGKVMIVSENKAQVILISDERCKVSAKVEGTRVRGILCGGRNQSNQQTQLILKYLKKEDAESLKLGMRVITSNIATFPADLKLGKITHVINDELNSTALVEPSVNFNKINIVFVIIKKKIEISEAENVNN